MRKIILLSWCALCLAGIAVTSRAGETKSGNAVPCSVSGRTRGGLDVRGSGDVAMGISIASEIVTLSFEEHQLLFTNRQMFLDGKERGKIPASPVLVEVIYTNQVLTVTAEGKQMLNTKVRK